MNVLKALLERGAAVVAFIPGSDETVKSSLSHERLRISSDKVKLSSLLPDMDISVNHANHGTLSALFLAGVPMVMIPTTIEQWMLAGSIERHCIGIGVPRNRLDAEFIPALEKVSSDRGYGSAAGRFAKKYAGYDQGRVLDRLAATIEGLPVWVRNRRGTATEEASGRASECTYRGGSLNEKTVR
jgi:UDP:flavonoid glycosyltransferase YjiC (YdhE family)